MSEKKNEEATAEKPVEAAVRHELTRVPAPSKDELQLERLKKIEKAAKALVAGWSATGFYDRQDPAEALALDEALQ